MRKWDEVTSDGLLTIIEYLKHNFDAELSRKVIELFHERMQDDEHVDLDVLYVLMKHVFAQIMDGRTADQAFGLKCIKGKYNPSAHWSYGSQHDGERYEVHLCEGCFFSTLSGLRRQRMVEHLFDEESDQTIKADAPFGLVERDNYFKG